MAWTESELGFMRAALNEAQSAVSAGEVPIGAVVVFDNTVVGAGHNVSISAHDPTGHAEIIALRAAALARGNHRLDGASMYVTLEPCAMCMAASAQARLTRLIFAAYDPKAGAAGSVIDLSGSPALNHRFEVNGGMLAEEAGELLQRFFEARRK